MNHPDILEDGVIIISKLKIIWEHFQKKESGLPARMLY